MRKVLALGLLVCAVAVAQIPQATDLPGNVFTIKKTWIIGGEGKWDFLTMDPGGSQLFIAHGAEVQVVDVETGQKAGTIKGLREAHAVAFDESGQWGYVTDGPAGAVVVFDRRTLRVTATIATAANPRALVYDAGTQLLFALSYKPPQEPGKPRVKPSLTTLHLSAKPIVAPEPPIDPKATTALTVINAQSQKSLGQILLPGEIDSVVSDGQGQIYFSAPGRRQIFRLDASASAGLLRAQPEATAARLDWSQEWSRLGFGSLPADCNQPRSLALDSHDMRLFVACESNKLAVLETGQGALVATLPLTSGKVALAYDGNHGLLYAADGNGILTIVRQHVTDSYDLVQQLTTRGQARSMAVNPVSGEVYLVTQVMGVDLKKPGGIGSLEEIPVSGSFQVLVVGN